MVHGSRLAPLLALAALILGLVSVAGASAAPGGKTSASVAGRHFSKSASKVGNRIAVHRHQRVSRSHSKGSAANETNTTGPPSSGPAASGTTGTGAKTKQGGKPSKPAPPATATPSAPTPPSEPLIPSPPPSEPTNGHLIFDSNFDGSFGGWYVQSLANRATITSTSPFAGSGAARFEVRQGDVEPDTGSNRSEISGPAFNAGEEIFVRDQIRIPSAASFSGSWQIIQQLHEADWGGSPGIAVFLNSSRALQLGAGDGSPTYWQSAALSTDRWYSLVYRVMLSQDASQGFVEVWLDGAQQRLLNGTTRMYGQTIQTTRTYLKAGIYRSSSSTGTSLIEHDDIVVGTSLAAVTAY